MKIYIAGPITGVLNYRQNFSKAERDLKSKGHIVLNPSYLPEGLKDYMPTCYAMIAQADTLYFLTGWKDSVGAKLENEYADKNNKRFLFEEHVDKEPIELVWPKNSGDNMNELASEAERA